MSSEIIWKYEKPNYEILLEKIEKLQKELDKKDKVIENLLCQVSDYLDEDTIEYLREIAGKE